MRRRQFTSLFTSATGLALLNAHVPGWAQALSKSFTSGNRIKKFLILIELKGGNDGLNTVIPFSDKNYRLLRNNIGIPEKDLIKIDDNNALHPSLNPLIPLWTKGEMAIIQGVGYPSPNLSHFRSIEIWETASKANEYLQTGWITPYTSWLRDHGYNFTADGVILGSTDLGPLNGSKSIALSNQSVFLRQAQLAQGGSTSQNEALNYILSLENDISYAAKGLTSSSFNFKTTFPRGNFGRSVQAAAQVAASQLHNDGIPVISLSLGSFDTHQNQADRHASLLNQLATGIDALKSAFKEINLWDDTLIMTYSEFGRRAAENESHGTDHGTASPHFVFGGSVAGGWYGAAPRLDQFDSTNNLIYTVDFRQMYATIAQKWWGIKTDQVFNGTFDAIPFLRA